MTVETESVESETVETEGRVQFLMDGRRYFTKLKYLLFETLAAAGNCQVQAPNGARLQELLNAIGRAGFPAHVISWKGLPKGRRDMGLFLLRRAPHIAWKLAKDPLFGSPSPQASEVPPGADDLNERVRVFYEEYDNGTDFGSQHQKIVIFSIKGEKTALVGGMNLGSEDWDDPDHPMYDPTTYFAAHDTAVMLKGPAVAEVEKIFDARWQKSTYPPATGDTYVKLAFWAIDLELPLDRRDDPAHYAELRYDLHGQLETRVLNRGNHQPIREHYDYTLAGWPEAIRGDIYSQTLNYRDGFGGTYVNGHIATQVSTYRQSPLPDLSLETRSSQWQYGYDPLGRLLSAHPIHSPQDAALGLGDRGQTIAYDSAGNLQQVPRGPAQESYAYHPKSNRVQALTAALDLSERFDSAEPAPGWVWGASNGGPSRTRPGSVNGRPCLQLAGGSPGHHESVRFTGLLPGAEFYTLGYAYCTDPAFGTQSGDCGWYLRVEGAAGVLAQIPLQAIVSASAEWQSRELRLPAEGSLGSLLKQLCPGEPVLALALVLINAKLSGGSAPGATLNLTDIRLRGQAPAVTPQDYGYDAAGRVTAAAGKLSQMSHHPVLGLPETAELDLARGSALYSYDARGLRSAERIRHPDGQTDLTLLLRDPQGRPLAKATQSKAADASTPPPEQVSYFLYDSRGLFAEVDKAAIKQPKYFLKDHQGSIRAVADHRGRVLQTYDYGPFGELIHARGAQAADFLYTGQQWDEALKLYNYNARLYDPQLRRFYGPDPAGEYPSPYQYVGNNPVNLVDPSGRMSRALTKIIKDNWDDASDFTIVWRLFLRNETALIKEYYYDVLPNSLWRKLFNQTEPIVAFGSGYDRLKNFAKSFSKTAVECEDSHVRFYECFPGQAGMPFEFVENRELFLQFLQTAMSLSHKIYFNLDGVKKEEVVEMAVNHPDIILNFFNKTGGYNFDKLNSTAVKFVQDKFPALAQDLIIPSWFFWRPSWVNHNNLLHKLYLPGHTAWELATVVSNPTYHQKATFFNGTVQYSFSELAKLVAPPFKSKDPKDEL